MDRPRERPSWPFAAPYPQVDALVVPPTVDWVGFDRYGVRDPDADEAYLAELAAVKAARSRPDQRLVLVMDTHVDPALHGALGLSIAEMPRVAASYARLAAREPDVVAVAGYVWPSGFGGSAIVGARGFSAAALARIRRELAGR